MPSKVSYHIVLLTRLITERFLNPFYLTLLIIFSIINSHILIFILLKIYYFIYLIQYIYLLIFLLISPQTPIPINFPFKYIVVEFLFINYPNTLIVLSRIQLHIKLSILHTTYCSNQFSHSIHHLSFSQYLNHF